MMRKILKIIMLLVLLVLISGCAEQLSVKETIQQITITDSIGRNISIPAPLTKVVVANYYNTEIINALGALDAVVGVDYGIYQDQEKHPGRFDKNHVIGKSQRDLNYEKIIEIAPQALILTSNGSWEDAERKLSKFGIKVIVLDAYYTEHFFDNCKLVGKIFGKEKQAEELSVYFQQKLSYITKQLQNISRKTIYFEYRREGNTTVLGDYFYNMIQYSGGKNIFADAKNISVDSESIIFLNPDYIVKVGENNINAKYLPPTPQELFQRKNKIIHRLGWDSISAVKNDNILLISHFAHGGASKLIGTMYIAKFMYPEYLPDLHPEEIFKVWLTKYQGLDYISGHTYPAFSITD